jgi:hypothetical protein
MPAVFIECLTEPINDFHALPCVFWDTAQGFSIGHLSESWVCPLPNRYGSGLSNIKMFIGLSYGEGGIGVVGSLALQLRRPEDEKDGLT